MRPLLALVLTAGTLAAEGAPIARETFASMEKEFDQRLLKPVENPFHVLGTTRGLYVEGFGAVLTTELNLVVGPTISPFRPELTKQEVAALKQRKLERLPILKEIMRSTLVSFAWS